MSVTFAQWVALVGMVAVAIVFLIEVRRWFSPGSVIGRKQRMLRVALTLLVEVLFAMMLAGPWVASHTDPITELIYWTICVFLGLSVVILALFDLRAVMRGYASLNRRICRDIREDERR
ncbi:MAG: hypothetical protein ACYC64_14525 [Armatimonadota bacterium]